MSKLDGTQITSSYRCPRCKGLVVNDLVLCETSYWLNGLRCVNCGWVKLPEKVADYAFKTRDRQSNKLDELELYKIRSRSKLRTTTLRTFTY